MSARLAVALEGTARKVFASAIEWPGWSRSGKTPEAAIEALLASARRYEVVAREAGERFPATFEIEIVERLEGSSGTEFGVPSRPVAADSRPTDEADADRLARLVDAAWTIFDRTVAAAPAELRKGPRGGGRDRDKILGHVVESDRAYAHEIGVRVPPLHADDREAVSAMRAAMAAVLRRSSDGAPLAGRRWPARYAARRIAWHALDHAWEIEDRTEPG